MPKVLLHRYPRLAPGAVRWFGWVAGVDSTVVEPQKVAELWDANSELRFKVQVSVDEAAIREHLDDAACDLIATVSCRETAVTASARSLLARVGDVWTAEAEVTLCGADLAEELSLDAVLVAPFDGVDWLTNRVIAERRQERVPLNQYQQGFPVSVISFSAEKLSAAPWQLVINAADPSDAFLQSIRLLLNEDYPQIRELLDGNPSRIVKDLLDLSIARGLIATLGRLARDATRPLDDVSAEFPESVAAAADRVARKYLYMSLSEACRVHDDQPERLEYLLMSEVRLLEGER